MKRILKPLLLSLLLLVSAPVAAARQAAAPARSAPWPTDVVQLAENLPVQDGGRVKPLHTHASYLLLRLNGKRSTTTPAGEKLGPVEWMLDLFFLPETSEDYAVFQVQDNQAVEAIGVSVEGKKKRDRYSFRELRPGVPKLFELARQYSSIEEKNRSSVQQQVFLLATNVNDYMQLLTHFDFARRPQTLGAGDELRGLFGGRDTAVFSEVLARVPELSALQKRLAGDPERAAELKSVSTLLHDTVDLTSGTESLALLPPEGTVEGEASWFTPADLVVHAFRDGRVAPAHLAMLASMEDAARARGDASASRAALARLSGQAHALADARGEERTLALEVRYHKLGLLDHSLTLFVLSFVLAAVLWLRPKSRILYYGAAASVGLATLLLVAVIVMRCLIRERPPVSTLYETLLFVTAMGAATALAAELINRQKIALSAAAVLGMIGLFVSNGYEMLDKRDTMPSLVAVLDTNFWLATHVTAITIGYSAGVLAALLANFYLVARVLGWRRGEAGVLSGLYRTVYGVLCFGLIFSTVGTILGGIWANESWGRFWGWDPKENGALLIVLSQLVILHARMGGILREFGVCMATAFGGIVIAFSWFGVNLLGVGLHSYGFTSGINTALTTYYAIQGGLLLVAGIHWQMERVRQKAVREVAARQAQPGLGGAS